MDALFYKQDAMLRATSMEILKSTNLGTKYTYFSVSLFMH